MEDRRLEKNCDIVVVGAGHAGCEAALACARLGLDTVMFTVSVDSIALMPCNPNIGGSSKGHLVRELDALGGEMGKNIDKTFIQSKMLNQSKGPAVHSLRAQADKQAYSTEMRKTLENQPNLTIKQGEVTELLAEEGKINEAENKLYELMDGKDMTKLHLALLFYEHLLDLPEEFLTEHGFSREEILEGVKNAADIYGVGGLAETLIS